MKEGWEYKKLGEIAEIQYGTRVVQKRDGGSIYPVYGGGGATFKMDTYNRENCLVVARFAMSPKCTRIVAGKFFLNDSGLTLKSIDTNKLSQEYLEKNILGHNDEIYLLGNGMAQKNLDMKAFRNLLIKYPTSLSKQQKIVSELDLLSGVIEKQKAQLEELDKLAQSIFYDMFGDPVTNEKGWNINVISDLFKVKSSKRVYQNEQTSEGIPFLRVSDILLMEEDNVLKPSLYISESKYNELSRMHLVPLPGDLLLTARGTLGKVYIIKKGDRFYFQDGMITWLDNKENKMVSLFCKYLIENQHFHEELIKSASISTVAFISITKLSNTKIISPTLSLQQEFAAKIEAIEAMKAKVRQSLKEAETLFNERMDYYFS